jgi:hypothetical protein
MHGRDIMDNIILAASLISFFALIASWVALPATNETSPVMAHGSAVRV